MKCLTVLDDRLAFAGISLGPNRQTGIMSNYCTVGDGIVLPLPVTQYPPPSISHIPKAGLFAVVGEAGIQGYHYNYARFPSWKDLSIGYPVLITPQPEDPKDAVLVYWAIDQTRPLGEVKSGTKNGGIIVDETYLHHPFGELMVILPPNSGLTVLCANGAITIRWIGQEVLVSRDR